MRLLLLLVALGGAACVARAACVACACVVCACVVCAASVARATEHVLPDGDKVGRDCL